MLLICEAILIVLGGYMLLTGKLEIGGVRAAGRNVRMAGGVLMAPLIFGVLAAPLFLMISGGTITEQLLLAAACVEMTVVIGAISLASWLVRQGQHEGTLRPFVLRTNFSASAAPAPARENAPTIMTVGEAAAYLRVTDEAVYDLINSGRLPAARISGEYRIARRAIDEYLAGESGPEDASP